MSIDLNRYTLFKNQILKSVTKLPNQGYCNINYIAITSSNNYLIREFKMDLNREFEFNIQKKAHQKGLAPYPILLDKKQNIMITEFAQGSHKTTLKKTELRQLATTIKKLHKLKTAKKPHNHKKDFKPKHKKAHATLLKLQKHPKALVTTHHDLNPKNILFSKKITLIDWEYAGVNDKYFDLATICVEFKLKPQMERYFLGCYLGRTKKINFEKLRLYKIVYQELYTLWMKENT